MKKVLVTGANGFVGKHLLAELLAHNMPVMAVGGKSAGDEKLKVKLLSLDLTDPKSTRAIDFKEVASVIHLAGLADVGRSFSEPEKYIQTNLAIEINLFEEALKQNSRPRFLIISSASVYDQGAKLPLREDSPIVPTSPYAVSKLGQENLAKYYLSRGFECIIARPFNHIGPGQGPGFIVPDLASQVIAAKHSNSTKIVVGNLNSRRDYTDVRDIARAYRLLIKQGEAGEIYNVCSGKSVNGTGILNGLMKAAGVSLTATVDKAKIRPVDTLDIYGSHKKLTDRTGWEPKIDLAQTLKDVMGSLGLSFTGRL